MNQKAGHLFTVFHVIRSVLLLFFLSAAEIVPAQQRLFTNQRHFGVEEGLPQSFVCGIAQDDDGFIWMATLDGLCRYDGRGFKTIRQDPKDSTSLAANVINNLERLQNNTITIYYSSTQADYFNLRTFKASRNKTMEQLHKIPGARWKTHRIGVNTGNWYFMTGDHKGMGWLDSKTGRIYYANRANGMLQQDTISAIVESAEGKLYLVSENGVQVSDTSRSKFEWIGFSTKVKKETAFEVANAFSERFSIVCLTGNRLAVAYKDKIIFLAIDKKSSTSIEPAAATIPGLASVNSDLQVDSRGRVYFENGGRIFRISEAGEMKLLWENAAKPTLRISAFFIDRSDVLWLSVNAQGVLKIDLQASLFKSYQYRAGFITDILEQAGVKKGVISKPQTYSEASSSFRHARDTKGNLFFTSNWIGENKIYQIYEQGLRSFPHFPDHTLYTAILTMPDNALWAYDQTSTAWFCWKSPSAVPEKLLLEKESMKMIDVTDARFIGGYIWMATENHGLLQYQGTKRINRFAGQLANSMMPETLTEICPDPVDQNKFWIGSRGSGLILWDVQKGLQRIYTIDDGLPNNTIYCILPDKAGKIWCSTNKGIFRFDAATGQVTAFEKTDGLPGNEFNRAHKFMFPDGRLAFGGLDGYTIFNPADFDTNSKTGEVPIQLTGLQVNNQPQDPGVPNSIIKEPLSLVSVVELPYHKNNLRFEFAALLYNQPQKIKYRYQLKDADAGWIENGTSNIASYAALRPGNYTFRINASDKNGLWNDTIKEIRIIIHPPFWATWWAWLIYACIAIGIIRWYFIFRERRLKTEQHLAFEKREAIRLRETDEMKDRFFSNITHEFRTPLTLIITPLEKLEQDPSLSAAAISTVKTAQRNSKQLLQLINEFLDFSKLNDGQLSVKLSTGKPDLFTADCVRSFEGAAKEKNITLDFSAAGIDGYYLFDEEKWGKLIANLLSNALKFTPVGGMVSVSLQSSTNDRIRLEVTDNGPGIPAEQQQKIFTRFYQVDDSAIRTYGGTGIGLSLVKELTELMQGTVEVESKPGGPTRFLVSIPMKKAVAVEAAQSKDTIQPLTQPAAISEQEVPLLLVVEDNDELRSFLVETMSNHYRVIEAADGLKARDLILQDLPDIVISDVMMPGQDGFDLCRICKADNRTAHIGFILLTSKAAHDARLKGLGTGADDYITKPFNLQELELRTANLLQLQQKLRSWLQAQLISTAPPEQLPEITDPFLAQLYQEMDAKLDDAELGVEHLCKTMGMSRSTLNRKLKSLLDISTNDLIRQYRLQKASRLLSSGLDISTVAYQVGFSSLSYFGQCFKEQYGITPSVYISSRN
ncbi:MAG: ATP-binding protein [Chitinophagaceae bacterium]